MAGNTTSSNADLVSSCTAKVAITQSDSATQPLESSSDVAEYLSPCLQPSIGVSSFFGDSSSSLEDELQLSLCNDHMRVLVDVAAVMPLVNEDLALG